MVIFPTITSKIDLLNRNIPRRRMKWGVWFIWYRSTSSAAEFYGTGN